MKPTMTYLFSNNFNIYAPPSPGHAFTADHYPSTVLRKDLKQVQEVLKGDEMLRAYFAEVEESATMTPLDMNMHGRVVQRVKAVLKETMGDHKGGKVITALRALSRLDDGSKLAAEISEYFISDHERYETHPLERLEEVEGLPGPLYVVGFSMGGVQALNVVARTGRVRRQVLLAPYCGSVEYGEESVPEITLGALGSLDVFELPFPLYRVSGRHLAACVSGAGMLNREEIYGKVREGVGTFCVVSEGDDSADCRVASRYFKQRIDNQRSFLFQYPKETGLDHSIFPHIDNPFSAALLREVLRFLLMGEVRADNLMKHDGDNEMPPVDLQSLELNM